ncbi:MAG: S-layer homology domain-containing protein [Patescibacteria group bacterium]
MFKKITSSIIAMCLMTMAFAITAFAQTNANTLDLIPIDAYGVIEINVNNIGPSISDLIDQYVDDNFPADDRTPEEQTKLVATIKDVLLGHKVTVGAKELSADSDDLAIFVILEATKDDFNVLVESSDTELTEMESQIDTAMLGSPGDDLYLMYFKNHMIVSNQQTLLEAIATQTDVSSLGALNMYQLTSASFLDNNFINIYMNFDKIKEKLAESGLMGDEVTQALNMLRAFGMSISKTDNGISLQTHAETNPEELSAIGINYSEMMHVPYLYQKMPNQDLILYYEGFNAQQSLKYALNEIPASFKEEIGLDLEEDVLSLLDKGYAIAIQDSDEIFPTGTLLIDVAEHKEAANNMLKVFVTRLWKSLQEEPDAELINGELVIDNSDAKIIITKTAKAMLNGSMFVFNIDIYPKESANPYAVQYPDELLNFEITLGVTGDSNLFISTDKEIAEKYGEGLLGNAGFDNLFKERDKEIVGVEYISFKNLGTYLQRMLGTMSQLNKNNAEEIDNAISAIDALTSVFKDFYAVSEGSNERYDSKTTLLADMDNIQNAWGNIMELALSAPKGIKRMDSAGTKFEDINVGEWYQDDVYYLATEGIITGYEDSTFKPGNEITRAEFLTLLMRALEEKGYFTYECWYPEMCAFSGDTKPIFKDVTTGEWYANYIYKAREAGIVDGYKDGTFKPNDLISRAEAVKMLSNAMQQVEIMGERQEIENLDFEDVSGEDWYFDSIKEARSLGIVQGVQPRKFEPLRSINRAESAKIIRKSLGVMRAKETSSSGFKSLLMPSF